MPGRCGVKIAVKEGLCRVNRSRMRDTIYRHRKINLVAHRPFVPSFIFIVDVYRIPSLSSRSRFRRRKLARWRSAILAATYTVAWANGGPLCNFICRDSIAEFIRSTGGNTSWKSIKRSCIMRMVLRVSRASTFGEPLNRLEREETRYFFYLFQ